MKIIETKLAEYKTWKINNQKDPYSAECVRYAESWAGMMEKQMASGVSLKDIAKKTSHDADTTGITGFMYSVSVQALANFWVHGEELRRWHNLRSQISNEGVEANASGGVLNTAILVTGK